MGLLGMLFFEGLLPVAFLAPVLGFIALLTALIFIGSR